MRLSPHDFDAVNAVILELHAPRTPAELLAAIPRLFLRAIPADYFRLVECTWGARTREVRCLRFWESDPRADAEFQRRFQGLVAGHPFVHAAGPHGRLDAVTLNDLVSVRQFRHTGLYEEVYRPADIGPLMGSALPTADGLLTLSVARELRARNFSDRDRLVLSLLQPHLPVALRNGRRSAAAATPAETGGAGRLTSREAEVAAWVSRGKSNPEIATILGTATRTVEKHVEHILAKLGVENRTAAMLALVESAR